MRVLSESLKAGRISIAEWEAASAGQIKMLYAESAMLARGGRNAMTKADWGKVGSQLKEQYRYLHSFARELAGADPADFAGVICGRPEMYANSARQAFWAMASQVAEDFGGKHEERWIAIGDDRTCAWCGAQAGRGWVALGELPEPGAGNCAGLTACRCRKEYRQVEKPRVRVTAEPGKKPVVRVTAEPGATVPGKPRVRIPAVPGGGKPRVRIPGGQGKTGE